MTSESHPRTDSVVSLREYVDVRVEAIEKTLRATAAALEKRLEGMNEFRAEMQDQRSLFMPRAEYEIAWRSLESDIRALREARAELAGKADVASVYWWAALSIASLLVAVAGVVAALLR